MTGQNEDQTNRRKFLTGAGLAGAAAVVTTPAAANVRPPLAEFSPEQISTLEEIVRNFITNAKESNVEPLGTSLALKGHGSHNNEAGAVKQRAPAATKSPSTTTSPTLKKWRLQKQNLEKK